jgi:hypothetical protein
MLRAQPSSAILDSNPGCQAVGTWLDGIDCKTPRLYEASIAFKYCSAVVRDRRASFSDPPDPGRKHCRTIATSEW